MKDIPGYEGLYSIDEDGNVFSYRRQNFLKPYMGDRGYLRVGLSDVDGNRKHYTIHRLVALTYILNPNDLPVVDHIDRNKANNSVENLRWVTSKENNLNKDLEKLHKAVEMRDKNNHNILIKTYSNCHQAALQEFGDMEKHTHISACARGEQKSAYGYFWKYVNLDTPCEEAN